jgi:hypothetical protein
MIDELEIWKVFEWERSWLNRSSIPAFPLRDWVKQRISSAPRGKCWNNTSNKTLLLLPDSFQFIIYKQSCHWMLCRLDSGSITKWYVRNVHSVNEYFVFFSFLDSILWLIRFQNTLLYKNMNLIQFMYLIISYEIKSMKRVSYYIIHSTYFVCFHVVPKLGMCGALPPFFILLIIGF